MLGNVLGKLEGDMLGSGAAAVGGGTASTGVGGETVVGTAAVVGDAVVGKGAGGAVVVGAAMLLGALAEGLFVCVGLGAGTFKTKIIISAAGKSAFRSQSLISPFSVLTAYRQGRLSSIYSFVTETPYNREYWTAIQKLWYSQLNNAMAPLHCARVRALKHTTVADKDETNNNFLINTQQVHMSGKPDNLLSRRSVSSTLVFDLSVSPNIMLLHFYSMHAQLNALRCTSFLYKGRCCSILAKFLLYCIF
jgi:hypothetical protein